MVKLDTSYLLHASLVVLWQVLAKCAVFGIVMVK